VNDGNSRYSAAALAATLAAFAPTALSYVGPGAGLGVIASLFAVILAVLATIVGLILWPIRKFSRRKKSGTGDLEHPKPE
jgi:hypothetical protein